MHALHGNTAWGASCDVPMRSEGILQQEWVRCVRMLFHHAGIDRDLTEMILCECTSNYQFSTLVLPSRVARFSVITRTVDMNFSDTSSSSSGEVSSDGADVGPLPFFRMEVRFRICY